MGFWSSHLPNSRSNQLLLGVAVGTGAGVAVGVEVGGGGIRVGVGEGVGVGCGVARSSRLLDVGVELGLGDCSAFDPPPLMGTIRSCPTINAFETKQLRLLMVAMLVPYRSDNPKRVSLARTV